MPSRHGMEGSPRWRAPLGRQGAEKRLLLPQGEDDSFRNRRPCLKLTCLTAGIVVDLVSLGDREANFNAHIEPGARLVVELAPGLRRLSQTSDFFGGCGATCRRSRSRCRLWRGIAIARPRRCAVGERTRRPVDGELQARRSAVLVDLGPAPPRVQDLRVIHVTRHLRSAGVVVDADARRKVVSLHVDAV